jgi:acyl-CoA thioesterase I
MNAVKARWFILICIVFTFACATSASAQIVALGASNTQGKGVDSSEAWPAVLQDLLRAKGSNTQVANAGISGDTTGGMLARLGSAVPDGIRLVILNFGGNDFKRGKRGGGLISPDARQANMAAIIGELHRRGIRTIEADGLINAAREAGMVQMDHIHLTAAGHRRVASQLVGLVR